MCMSSYTYTGTKHIFTSRRVRWVMFARMSNDTFKSTGIPAFSACNVPYQFFPAHTHRRCLAMTDVMLWLKKKERKIKSKCAMHCSLFGCQSYLNNQSEILLLLFFFPLFYSFATGIWQGQADEVSLQRKLREIDFSCLIKVTHN